MRAEVEGGVPVPTKGRSIRTFLGFDVDLFAGFTIVADEAAILGLGVDGIGIIGIDGGIEAIAEDGDEPVVVADAVDVIGLGGSTLGGVILGTAVDVVEGFGLIDGDFIELSEGKIFGEAVGLAAIEGFVETAVAANDEVIGVIGVDDHGVVIDVFGGFTGGFEGFATIVADHDHGIEGVDAIHDVRIGDNFLVVLGRATDVARLSGPGFAAIGGAEEAAGVGSGFDDSVEHIGLDGGDGKSDTSFVTGRETARDRSPGLSSVGGLVDIGFRTAIEENPLMATSLVRGGVEGIGITGIHHDIGDPRVIGDVEDFIPCSTTVGGFIEPAIAAAGPERSLARDEDGVAVAGIDEDFGDVFGLVEADFGEALSAIERLVETIAVSDASLAIVFPGADPQDITILGIESEAADGVGAVLVEDGIPRGTGVGGLPDTT